MVKKSLKDLEIESLEMLGDSKSDVLVVFKNAEGMSLLSADTLVHLNSRPLFGIPYILP